MDCTDTGNCAIEKTAKAYLDRGNLRLTSDGRLKILDFGLAKLRQPVTETATTESSLQTQSIPGTLPYMSPEQLSGEEADARTNIHEAGFVLYEMATGQRPLAEVQNGQSIGALMRKRPIPPTKLNPKVSAELERIIDKCVEKDPENRYQSVKGLAIDLRRQQTGVLRVLQPTRKLARWWSAKSVGLALVSSHRSPYCRSLSTSTGCAIVFSVMLTRPHRIAGGAFREEFLRRSKPGVLCGWNDR